MIMKSFFITRVYFFFVFLFFLFSCYSVKNIPISINSGQIPPQLTTTDTLLVVKSNIPGTNTGLEKNFKQSYSGNFLIIREKELQDFPPSKFRYLFASVYHGTSYTSSTGKPSGAAFSCGITDRLTNQEYRTDTYGSYTQLTKAYIEALNQGLRSKK